MAKARAPNPANAELMPSFPAAAVAIGELVVIGAVPLVEFDAMLVKYSAAIGCPTFMIAPAKLKFIRDVDDAA